MFAGLNPKAGRMRRSSVGDVMTIDDPILEVTSHSPLVFRPKAPWSEVHVVSSVERHESDCVAEDHPAGDFHPRSRPWPFDREWMHSIGMLSVWIPKLRLEEHDYLRLGDDASQLTDEFCCRLAFLSTGPNLWPSFKLDPAITSI